MHALYAALYAVEVLMAFRTPISAQDFPLQSVVDCWAAALWPVSLHLPLSMMNWDCPRPWPEISFQLPCCAKQLLITAKAKRVRAKPNAMPLNIHFLPVLALTSIKSVH